MFWVTVIICTWFTKVLWYLRSQNGHPNLCINVVMPVTFGKMRRYYLLSKRKSLDFLVGSFTRKLSCKVSICEGRFPTSTCKFIYASPCCILITLFPYSSSLSLALTIFLFPSSVMSSVISALWEEGI